MWLPLLMPAPSELKRAGDPEVACVEADDLVAGVKDAPVARPRTPERDRFDVTSWCYTITGRRHGLPSHLSIAELKHVAFPSKDDSPCRIGHLGPEEARFRSLQSVLGGLLRLILAAHSLIDRVPVT